MCKASGAWRAEKRSNLKELWNHLVGPDAVVHVLEVWKVFAVVLVLCAALVR